MAGQAAKKAERAREQASNLYYPIIFAANVIFVLFRGKLLVYCSSYRLHRELNKTHRRSVLISIAMGGRNMAKAI